MSKPRIPYFDFYPADFMHGVRGLTAQEVGIYTMLLCRIYEENGPVQLHPARLSAYCGTRESVFLKAFERLVDLGKFTVAEGMISNARASLEIESRERKLKLNSHAGKISAEKRQQKQASKATDVQRKGNHTDTDTEEERGGGGYAREAVNAEPEFRERMLTAIGVDSVSGLTGIGGATLGTRHDMERAAKWQADLKLDQETIIATLADTMAKKRDGPPSTFKYFDQAMQRAAARKSEPKLTPIDGGYHDRPTAHDRREAAKSDATNRQIAFAARARRTPGTDLF